jgi:hypothetical protein
MLGWVRPRFTYANVMATVAVFIALGGASYAAIKLPKNSVGSKQLKSGAVKASDLGNNAVSSPKVANGSLLSEDFAAGQLPQGPKGAPGDPGRRGETGPAGAASVSASLAGPVSTGSASPVDLGGPSVTVNVGSSGLIAYWVTATLKSVGGGTAQVYFYDNYGAAPQIQSSGSSPVKYYTEPGSNTGTIIFNGGLSTRFLGYSGTDTVSLRFADTAGTGVFEDVELVVIPF